MRVLVTGGAGFIGSHLCGALHERGDEVWCADNLVLGRPENVARLASSKRFHFEKLDVLDKAGLDRLFKEARLDAVFHLAANSDIQKGGEDHEIDLHLTFLTTFEVLEAMRRHGVKKIFFASSSAVFGESKERLHEDHGPLKPISFYGASKLASEAFLSVFSDNYQFQVSILRFPNVIGPRSTHGVVYDFLERLKKDPSRLRILGDGAQKKPYLHVQDLVKAILLVSDKAPGPFSVYHAGGEDLISVTELAEVILKAMGLKGCRLEYTGGDRGWVGDVPYFQYDVSKLKALGWKHTWDSREAVRRTVLERP